MKRPCFALLVLVLALPAYAELGYKAVSATATSQTINTPGTYLKLINDDGTNEIYLRIFLSSDAPGAATTAHAQIKKGEVFEFRPPGGSMILAVSIVCDTAETATVRLFFW